MACVVRFLRPVFFVRWVDPKATDVPNIERELEAAYKRHGGPVIYVAVVPVECTPPDEKVRAGFIERMREVLTRCETMHFVMEGEGFKNAIMRNALVTVLLVRGQRTKVFVHKTLENALMAANDLASKDSKFGVAQMLINAREAGVASIPPAALG